jgi:hypothetical protein
MRPRPLNFHSDPGPGRCRRVRHRSFAAAANQAGLPDESPTGKPMGSVGPLRQPRRPHPYSRLARPRAFPPVRSRSVCWPGASRPALEPDGFGVVRRCDERVCSWRCCVSAPHVSAQRVSARHASPRSCVPAPCGISPRPIALPTRAVKRPCGSTRSWFSAWPLPFPSPLSASVCGSSVFLLPSCQLPSISVAIPG